MIPFSYYILVGSLATASVIALSNFKKQRNHLKLFTILLCIDLVNELIASFGFRYLKLYFHFPNNLAVYNLFVLFEFPVYAIFFMQLITFRWFRVVAISFISGFVILWIWSFFLAFGMFAWNSYVHVAGSGFTVLLCLLYFYQVYTQEDFDNFARTTEFWIAVALFLFYVCNLPYVSLLNFLIINYPDLAFKLGIVLRILNIVMYSFIIFAYLCPKIRTMKFL